MRWAEPRSVRLLDVDKDQTAFVFPRPQHSIINRLVRKSSGFSGRRSDSSITTQGLEEKP
jgi:hypothetical protein